MDKTAMQSYFDPKKRAEQKRESRRLDREALASGAKSREELRKENGWFAFLNVTIDLSSAKRLY